MKQYPATYAEFAAYEEGFAREDLVAALAALDAKDLMVNSVVVLSARLRLESASEAATGTTTSASPTSAASASVSPKAPPPCIHETCSERLAGLRCETSGRGPGMCNYVAYYQHHCDCDQWATVEP